MREPAYNLVAAAASITLPEGGWKFTVWGKNLLNEQYHAYVQTGTSGDFGQAAAPRTYGISIEKKF